MLAAVFSKPGNALTIEEVQKPEITADEMLVKVSYCGICGTDIHASRAGPFMAAENTIFGHEFSGEIVEIGENLQGGNFNLGDRVTSLPFMGEKTIGISMAGAYSEYVRVGYDLVVKIPDEMDDQTGALVEPLAVGLHSVKMAGNVGEKDVLIIGAGPIGLACAVWCRFFGARNVVLSEKTPSRIAMARQFGFSDFVDPEDDISRAFIQIAGNAPAIQFECVGAPGIMQQCLERAPKRGLVMGIGVCDAMDSFMPLIAFAKELRIQWAVGYDKEDFELTIDMMVAKRIDASPMVTDVITLAQVPEVFEALRTPSTQCKVLIDLNKK